MTELSEAVASLSERERLVLTLLATGKRNVEIAAEIGVKPRTISQFKLRAAEKLGLDHPSDVALVDAARAFGAFTKKPREEVPEFEVTVTSNLPADIFEIASEYPGKIVEAEWKRAEPLIRRILSEGISIGRLRHAALLYRRQYSALANVARENAVANRQPVPPPKPVTPPEKFFAADGPWQGAFPLPAYVEIPPEPVPGDGM